MDRTVNHNNNEKTQEVLFSEIFCQQEQHLYNLAFRLTKSDQAAKDIIQEVFLKVWEKRDSLHTISNIEAWLYRITENKIIDFLRKVAADQRLRNAIWDQVQQIVNEAELHVAAKEYNKVIQEAIAELPPQRKLIYKLHKEEGMDYQKIAAELNLSRHTVKNQLFAAVQSVRKFILKHSKLFFQFF